MCEATVSLWILAMTCIWFSMGLHGSELPSLRELPGLYPAIASFIHCCSVPKSCPTLCDPMDCNIPGFTVLHYLLEFSQTHVHWVSVAIQPSHPLLSPPSSALNLSQHQVFFSSCWLLASGSQSTGTSESVLTMNIQGWFPLGLTGFISLLFKGLSRVFSSTTV